MTDKAFRKVTAKRFYPFSSQIPLSISIILLFFVVGMLLLPAVNANREFQFVKSLDVPLHHSLQTTAAQAALSLTEIVNGLRTPTEFAYHLPNGKLLFIEKNLLGTYALTFRAADGSSQAFAALPEIAADSRLAIVRETSGGFSAGEIFISTDNTGTIARLSPDGKTAQTRWVTLPGETSLVPGGLCFGETGLFKDRLLAVTTSGNIWQLDATGKIFWLARIPSPLSGVAVVPTMRQRFGDWAGKILVGAKVEKGIYAIDAQGVYTFYPLGIAPADIRILYDHENLLLLDSEAGSVRQATDVEVAPFAGNLFIATESSDTLYLANWNSKSPVLTTFRIAQKVSHLSTAPACHLLPEATDVSADGASGEAQLAAPYYLNWTAISDTDWLRITANPTGKGSAVIQYAVEPNTTDRYREAMIHAANQKFVIRQQPQSPIGCQFDNLPGELSFPSGGGNGSITITPRRLCEWKATSEDSFITITNCCGTGNGVVSFTLAENFSPDARKGKISIDKSTVIIVQGGFSPGLMVNAGADQIITLPNLANLSGTVSGAVGAVTVDWSKVSGPGSVIFSNASLTANTAMFSAPGSYVLRLTARDSQTMASDEMTVTVNADPTPPPPDPISIAPPLDPTETTTIGDATEFLYTPPNAIQIGVTPGTINKMRVAVLRGRVLDENGQAIARVKVTILNHPEFGFTFTRADGKYDMAVNGGAKLTLSFEKAGLLPSQRAEDVPWQDYVCLQDLVMKSYDDRVTTIELSAPAPVQVARGTTITDSDGSRQATLFFKQGTTAMMTLPGGGTQPLANLHVRATEYTVGAMGPKAMPGDLPPTSSYTYATELSVDEAVSAGATSVVFNQPVPFYLENFVGIPVGKNVPTAFYDRSRSEWVPEPDGRVIKILSITAGVADLDTNGDGLADNDTILAQLGINLAERQQLAVTYTANQTLWRIPVQHFTPGDHNYPTNPPADAIFANQKPPKKDNKDDDPCKRKGSTIECQNQILGETLGVTGTSLSLNYVSDRVPGRTASNILTIALSGQTLPASLQRIDLTVEVAGQVFRQEFPPQVNQTFTYTWDGRDAYGRILQGQQIATVTIGYAYDALYQEPPNFPQSFGIPSGISFANAGSRIFVILNQEYKTAIGAWDARLQAALGGWTLSAHHAYDPVGKVLQLGDGTRRSAENIDPIMSTAAALSFQPQKVAVAANGTVFVLDGFRILRINADGTTTVVAGGGGSTAEGVPATQAFLVGSRDFEIASDGSIYISVQNQSKVRRIGTDGLIRTVAGNGLFGFSGDGGPATQAQLNSPLDIGLAPDGSLYIADGANLRIRRVGADGRIATIAGNGQPCFLCAGDGPAPQAAIGQPTALEVAPDGSVYYVNQQIIFRVPPDASKITRVVGGGTQSFLTDGVPATDVQYFNGAIQDIAFSADGLMYLTTNAIGSVAQLVDNQGLIYRIAGKGQTGFSGDRGPARQAVMNLADAVAVGADGAIYIVDRINNRIRKVSAPLPGFSGGDITIASEEGGLLYRFSPQGRHLNTFNALTNATLLTFGYDTAGRLMTITDADNNVTTIERDGNGNATAIVSPFGQRTALTLDANGYLTNVINPNNETTQFTYTNTGLMISMRDTRNNLYQFQYDALGRLTRDSDPANGFQMLTLLEQNPTTKEVSVNTALNRLTRYRVEQLQSGIERRTTFSPDGTQAQHSFGADRVHTITAADGTTNTFTEGGDPRYGMNAPQIVGQNLRLPSGLQLTTSFTRTATLADPNNLASLIAINNTATVNGLNFTSTYTAATRTYATNTPLGRQTTTLIDPRGRVTQAQIAGLNGISYVYDSRGRLANTTTGTGAEARMFSAAYNAQGFLASVTDEINRTASYTYDTIGQILTKTFSDNRVVNFGYDIGGNLTSFTPPGRPAHLFAYNALDQVTSYTPPDIGAGAQPITYTYNNDHQLTREARPGGVNVDFAYDAAGRLSAITQQRGVTTLNYSATTGLLTSVNAPGGINLAYTYDGSLPLSTTLSGAVAGSVQATYDNFFRVANLRVNNANPITFTYDNDGLLTQAGSLQLTRNAQNGLLNSTTLGNVTDTRTRNGFGEVTDYAASFNSNQIFRQQFVYDKTGSITRQTESIGGATDVYDYTYNLAGRLVDVKKNNVTTATYTYDANGNRTNVSLSALNSKQRVSISATYDNQDRMTQYDNATYAYTANGELQSKSVSAQTTTYTYDAAGNLMQVVLPAGTQIDYLIDGQNQRIGKKVNGALVKGFLYQGGGQIIAELDASNAVASRFVYATGGNAPDYMIRGGVTYRLITDQLGSVRLVVDAATSAIAQRLDYDEFGRVLADTNPGFQPFGFAGGLYDADTGLVRFGARDYDAETGRWTSKDKSLFTGGDTNLYVYCGSDPLNFKDVSGFAPGKVTLNTTQVYNEKLGRYENVTTANAGGYKTGRLQFEKADYRINGVQTEVSFANTGRSVETGINKLTDDKADSRLTRKFKELQERDKKRGKKYFTGDSREFTFSNYNVRDVLEGREVIVIFTDPCGVQRIGRAISFIRYYEENGTKQQYLYFLEEPGIYKP